MNLLAPLPNPATPDLLPDENPLDMPVRGMDAVGAAAEHRDPAVTRRRVGVAGATLAIVVLLAWVMVEGLLRDGFGFADAVIMAFYVPSIAWTGFAAVTAVLGATWMRGQVRPEAPARNWLPVGRTAILIPVRNEDVAALRQRITALRADLGMWALRSRADIFVLSDSDDPRILRAELTMVRHVGAAFPGWPPVYYRRRSDNNARKPGNIADWLRRWGGAYSYMLVLDADSRMSARRIAGMVSRMERESRIGLIQAGLRLTGAASRFARLQQRATRLYGPAFAAGIAGWAGPAGNYWGHNALLRVRAFAEAGGLPRLSGTAPFGGDILSHDFIEAAWLRRAGWQVVVDPDGTGSAEGGPETMEAFHKRDRRWAQGNLQHLRVLFGARGLHPVSRLHLVCGIFSYIAAPLWLGLVLAATLSGSIGNLILPLIGALTLIFAQKLAGIAVWVQRRPAVAGRVFRLAATELALSSLIAPIIMVRQTHSVVSVLAGQDCGWKPAGSNRGRADTMPWLEPLVGAALLATAMPGVGDASQTIVLLPLVLPLLAAPAIARWLDATPGEDIRWQAHPAPVAIPMRTIGAQADQR